MEETAEVTAEVVTEVTTGAGRKTLNREVITDAAYALIDREGPKAFTMRTLGAHLGVSAMAVYGYFSSREEVLASVLTRFMGAMDTYPVPGERWDDTLRRTMTSLYQSYRAHPNLSHLDFDTLAGFKGLEDHTRRIVTLHADQGIPEPVLAKMWAFVDAFLTGFIINAPTWQPLEEDDQPTDLPRWKRVIRDAYTDESFAAGIEMIIAATRALAAPDPCDWRTPS